MNNSKKIKKSTLNSPAGGIMTDEVRSRVALHDIDPVALTARLESDLSVVEAIAPFIRKKIQATTEA